MGLLLDAQVQFLEDYGYLSAEDAAKVSDFDDIELKAAIEKYQRFDANVARQAMVTGDIDSATQAAMMMPRCQCPDNEVEAALGTGGWRGCHGLSDAHAAIVDVDPARMPGFLKPEFVNVLRRVQRSYAEIGLLFRFRNQDGLDMINGERISDHHRNIRMTFTRGSNWIGLAIVGNGHNQQCSSEIWAKFDYRYQPRNVVSEWTTLIKHELGHNAGLRHTRGGVMNPSIVNGLPVSWKGDPHEETLRKWYGGDPVEVPGNPKPPEDDDDWPAPFNPIGESFQLAEGVRAQLYRVMGG